MTVTNLPYYYIFKGESTQGRQTDCTTAPAGCESARDHFTKEKTLHLNNIQNTMRYTEMIYLVMFVYGN